MGNVLFLIAFLNVFVLGFATRFQTPTPDPKYPSVLRIPFEANDVAIHSREDNDGNAWERSGLYQGDIATSPSDTRNALKDPSTRWTIPIPVYVNASDFDPMEMMTIEMGIREIESKTCVRFRQYQTGDKSFIVVRGNGKGCYSMVGRRDGGQVVHLQKKGCVHHGIVVHEFLHALGLHHQQSSPDRDDYVDIHYANILKGREYNFNKYTTNTVTTFGLDYDYGSVMHYSSKAFSSNGEETITPKDRSKTIGQRKGMSKLDTEKIRIMYNCAGADVAETKPTSSFVPWGFLLDRFTRRPVRKIFL